MEILRPQTVWINGICYRKPFQPDYTQEELGEYREHDDYEDFQEYTDSGSPEIGLDVQQLENGRFRLKFHVHSSFYGLIIGKKGATKKRIGEETKTRLDIPKNNHEDSKLILTSEGRNHLIDAYNRIQMMVENARSRLNFTHFISIPLNHATMKESFAGFKAQVLSELGDERGIEDSVFQDTESLHMTVTIMALLDTKERIEATELLQDCKEEILLPIIGDNPMQIEVKGLEIMNDDASEACIVYGKVRDQDGSDNLQQICDAIMKKFAQSRLGNKEYEKVKIHMTLMNTLFTLRAEEDKQEVDGKKRKTLDARNLLKKFGDFNFGTFTVDEIHLSQRWAGRKRESGYYKSTSVLHLGTCG